MAKIKKKHLLRIGFDEGKALREAMAAMTHEAYTRTGREAKLEILQALLNRPEHFINHDILGDTARHLAPDKLEEAPALPTLRDKPLEFEIFGAQGIEPGAINQMYTAAKLPISRAAALMPDAHQGYGLPVGGVLATEAAVIPYAVGVDIGCRMALSVYNLRREHLERYRRNWTEQLKAHTFFGAGSGPDRPMEDEVLDRDEFRYIDIAKKFKDKAWKQIGSSGSGNHFVEFGLVEITDPENEWGLEPGTYVGLLSHSGSRALGAAIARHFTDIAMKRTRLPKVAKNLAWLDMGSEPGMEYWAAMNLAGDYATACHRHIHKRLSNAIGERPLFVVENHHNFAWKEKLADGSEVIVHRKGATPAGRGVLGIIPGSMTDPGYIVRGKGLASSINSASHGAGRLMSRSRAKSSFTRSGMRKLLNEKRVSLIGGGPDEAPLAYKDIQQVMAHQQELVDVIGKFTPKIVRMAGD